MIVYNDCPCYSESQSRLTISGALFGSTEERGRRRRLLERIIEFLKIPKVVLDKLKKRKLFQSSRIFGSSIPAITQVGTVVTK